MNSFLDALLIDFPPPENPYHPVDPTDFTGWNLNHQPPTDLIWLYETYGEGTFHVGSGDPIRLLMPTERNVALLDQFWETLREIVLDGSLDSDLFTVGHAWFAAETRPEVIHWGSSSNGVDLMSIWFSDEIGWATVLFDSVPCDCVCIFRSPARSLQDAIQGSSVFSGLFPWAERPFSFIPSPSDKSADEAQNLEFSSLPSSSDLTLTPEEIQRLVDQSSSSIGKQFVAPASTDQSE